MFKIIFSIGLVFAGIIGPAFQSVQASTNPNLQVAVISDTHIDPNIPKLTRKFEKAMDDLNTIVPSYDAIAVNGDMTNYGRTKEYDLFNSVFKTKKNSTAEEFMAIGNHEWLDSQGDASVTDEELKNRFLSNMNVSNLYYDKWIKGYHFITIGGEKSEKTMLAQYGSKERDSAYISDEQFQWLENTLSINADSSKPIFVFFHQPITNTVYGSEWGAGLEDQKILALLKKYPQVILFTGHSHYPINNPKSIVTDGITMVNTSSVAYTYTPKGKENYTQSQGYVVNVYDDKVELKAREFSNGTWIKTVTIPLGKSKSSQTEWVNYQGDWYYYDSKGNLKKGWFHSNGQWYYLDKSTGKMQTGWVQIDYEWYYFNDKGEMQTGWQKLSGKWYNFNAIGSMRTGWYYENEQWYFLRDNGTMATTNTIVFSKLEHFNQHGQNIG
ncbi:metallophosphoesterase family protein [Neobacillus bataviensis]|uniref:metallophosphoesterase family protein n=1 Tax=Neobacillus bataviensis TaxID=220685 RepID=UPI001CBCD478|nr:metallophosphoesterase [Neobacillus bataviensis]